MSLKRFVLAQAFLSIFAVSKVQLRSGLPDASPDAPPGLQPDAVNMEAMLEAEKDAMDPADPKAQLKEELAALLWLEQLLKEKVDAMDEKSYSEKIAVAQESLANANVSSGLARMLGDMRREMHTFAAPFYLKVLNEQIEAVQAKQQLLLKEIEGTPEPKKTEAPPPSRSFSPLVVVGCCMLVLAAIVLVTLLIVRARSG
mmetsp:Transcript_22488/g.49654  ORF Transcript_22488/g.49654 Transcript_22488/m.49654 type:complete len:200 (-) Transcript_22488:123-722(-)|eukprot:CAMPEP_0170618662 /NCGR_PEP_ID=MMETSP0224-20130122/27078_1 /TAXON_ID=285029 /ORGANISM="Togula jolla, Strain CCCM 725" /LENGTH=199 /DNA_ID=CAMNT_0010944651 /DNA_START=55 /DNA_END=654 /DNA_ORIENTATION=-